MKVLVISHMYPSTANGIAGIFVHKQVKALIKQGVEVKVVCPVPFAPFPINRLRTKWADYSNIPESAVLDGVEVFYPRYVEFPRSILFGYSGYFVYEGIKKTIKEISKDFKFDIIHSHVALPDGFAAQILNRQYNLPHVVTIHGQDLQVTVKKSEICKKNVYRTLESADRIITVSSKLKRMIENGRLLEKTCVINNGVEIDNSFPMGLIDIEKNRNTILSVSNLNKSKGIDLNIRAVGSLIEKYPGIMYYIIGDGPEKENLMKLVSELKLGRNVVFLGRLPHDAVLSYMAESFIFSLPSYEEGFGVVYIEAMAQGRPVIGVKGEGIEDVIIPGKNGFLVEPRNYEDIARTIDFIFENPERAIEIGREGRDYAEKKLSWDDNAAKTIRIYNQVGSGC